MSDSSLVHLASAGNNAEASILRSYLEDHGIHCYVQGENHRAMLGVLGGYIEINLMVPEADLDRARLLLQEYENASIAPDDDASMMSDDKAEDASTDSDSDEGARQETGEDELPAERRRHQALMRLRGARIFGLLFPVGLVHLLVGARVRGVVMLATCFVSWYLTWTRSPSWVLLTALVIVFDMVGAGVYVHEQLGKHGAGADRAERA
jgi:hypothetical protein